MFVLVVDVELLLLVVHEDVEVLVVVVERLQVVFAVDESEPVVLV